MTQKEKVNELTKEEQKIYYSIMAHFPNTSHYSAYDKAIQGGVNFNFICK
jgi:hypothetical protein